MYFPVSFLTSHRVPFRSFLFFKVVIVVIHVFQFFHLVTKTLTNYLTFWWLQTDRDEEYETISPRVIKSSRLGGLGRIQPQNL